MQGVASCSPVGNERAEVILEQAAEAAVAGGAVWAGVVARSELALLALERRDLAAAESELALAGALVDDASSSDYVGHRDPAGRHREGRDRPGAGRARAERARERASARARC